MRITAPFTGHALKAARAACGWNQEDLARAARLALCTVVRLERMGSQHIECQAETERLLTEAFATRSISPASITRAMRRRKKERRYG